MDCQLNKKGNIIRLTEYFEPNPMNQQELCLYYQNESTGALYMRPKITNVNKQTLYHQLEGGWPFRVEGPQFSMQKIQRTFYTTELGICSFEKVEKSKLFTIPIELLVYEDINCLPSTFKSNQLVEFPLLKTNSITTNNLIIPRSALNMLPDTALHSCILNLSRKKAESREEQKHLDKAFKILLQGTKDFRKKQEIIDKIIADPKYGLEGPQDQAWLDRQDVRVLKNRIKDDKKKGRDYIFL